MKNRLETCPPLEALNEGDIIQTVDGYVLICVPDPESECRKALTDGDLWIDNDEQIGVSYRFVPPAEHTCLGAERMAVLLFVLQRAQDQAADLAFYSNFYRMACYVSPN